MSPGHSLGVHCGVRAISSPGDAELVRRLKFLRDRRCCQDASGGIVHIIEGAALLGDPRLFSLGEAFRTFTSIG